MKNDETGPTQPCHGGFQPGRLWSLWDMLKLKSEDFLRVNVTIGQLIGIVAGWETAQKHPDNLPKPNAVLTDSACESTENFLAELAEHLEGVGAPLSKMEAKRILAAVKERPKTTTYSKVRDSLVGLKLRIRDEISLLSIYILDPARKKYFEHAEPPFGAAVSDKLPSAIPDIEDAGKSLALNMGTASVFHSMRVMEAALKRLANLLGIPYAPSWESYISQIEGKITAKHKTKSIQWKRDEAFYREILGDLQTVKLVWRNPTMHIVRRYSVDEAEQIYGAVRVFLQRLAPRLPDQKIPKTNAGTS